MAEQTAVSNVRSEALRLQARELQRRGLDERKNIVGRALKNLDDIGRAFASGLTFGHADEIAGYMESIVHNRPVQEMIAQERARDKTIHPAIAIGGEIAGAIASPISGVGGAFVRGAQGAAKVAKFAAVGATEGAIAGFGHAEGDVLEQAGGTAQGTAVGGVLGATTPPLVGVVVRVMRRILGQKNLDAKTRRAVLELAEKLKQDEVTPEAAAAKLRELGPEAMVADLPGAESVKAQASGVANVPGPARTVAVNALEARAISASDRAEGAIMAGLSDKNAVVTRNALIANRARLARPLYEKAFEEGGILKSPAIDELMEKSVDIKRAIRQARGLPEFADVPDTHIALLDKAYKNIGGKYSKALRAGDKELARDLNELRLSLRKAIVDEVPTYGKALDTFSSETDLIDALDLGRKFIREETETLQSVVEGMTAGEREQFTIGVARTMIERLNTGGDKINVAKRLFGNKAIRAKLESVFPTKEGFAAFEKSMFREAAFAETTTAVLGGSPTARRTTEVADVLGETGLAIRGDAPGIFLALARMARLRPKIPSKQAGEVLFTPGAGPGTMKKAAEEQAIQTITRALSGGIIAGGVQEGSQFGRQ
jgi:hypothetical protein